MAIFLANLSCTPAPTMILNRRRLSIGERIERASLVMIGVVASETRVIERGIKSDDSLELRRVNVDVESVLKGKLEDAQLSFVYFFETGSWTGHAPNLLVLGERCLFYLLRDGTVWRATNDVYSSHTEIATGRHRVNAVKSDEAVRQLVARVLIEPGDITNLKQYLDSLAVGAAQAFELIGAPATAEILGTLLENPNAQIRGRACALLAEPPFGNRDCLSSVSPVGASPVGARH